ncbi:MAG: FimV/HubP family polar landmark protein [Rhodanobacter sp.]
MNRLLKLPLVIALALGSTQLLAVDFGQVRVMSNLGQPLQAEIPLRGVTAAELQNLTAQLASGEEYERAGITGGRTKVPLSFSVVTGPGGQRVIRITSTTPVDDPYLDLLLDVNTSSGKSVHEFAILLDPPGTPEPAIATGPARPTVRSPASTGAVAPKAAPAEALASKPVPGKSAQAPLPSAVATKKPAPAAVKGMYGPVERGQTLSGIAQLTTPAGVDINQMLLAIKQANPDAFYRDNINTLKAGAVLRVPGAADAQAMTVAAAMAEVRRQNSDWHAGSVGTPTTVADTATRRSASSAPTTAATKPGDRLALLAAQDTGKSAGGGPASIAGGHAGESATELRKSLARAQENLASEKQQVADLNSHLQELNDVNGKSERLLSMKDNEIAELQAKLAAARKAGLAAPASSTTSKAAPAAAAAVATAKSAAGPTPTGAAMGPAVGGSAGNQTVSSAASAAVAASAPVAMAAAATSARPIAKSTPSPVAVPKSAIFAQPWYMQPWAWLAGAGAIVLLILLALLGRRRARPVPVRVKSAPSLADSFAAASPAAGLSADDVDQAELLDRLAEHPDDLGLHLQLVTLYYSRRDVERFEAAAEAMYAHVADPQQDEWQDVVHMGEDLVPEHPLFTHQVQPSVQGVNAPLEEFNIDEYAAGETPTLSGPDIATSTSLPVDYPHVDDTRVDFSATAPSGFQAVSDQLDVVPDAYTSMVAAVPGQTAPVPAVETGLGPAAERTDDELGEFNDDPIDTKLDLARAYLDMGDDEGARAMLDEVLKEGSQMQKDVAASLLRGLQH